MKSTWDWHALIHGLRDGSIGIRELGMDAGLEAFAGTEGGPQEVRWRVKGARLQRTEAGESKPVSFSDVTAWMARRSLVRLHRVGGPRDRRIGTRHGRRDRQDDGRVRSGLPYASSSCISLPRIEGKRCDATIRRQAHPVDGPLLCCARCFMTHRIRPPNRARTEGPSRSEPPPCPSTSWLRSSTPRPRMHTRATFGDEDRSRAVSLPTSWVRRQRSTQQTTCSASRT